MNFIEVTPRLKKGSHLDSCYIRLEHIIFINRYGTNLTLHLIDGSEIRITETEKEFFRMIRE